MNKEIKLILGIFVLFVCLFASFTKIETQIMAYCFRQKKKMEKNIMSKLCFLTLLV